MNIIKKNLEFNYEIIYTKDYIFAFYIYIYLLEKYFNQNFYSKI